MTALLLAVVVLLAGCSDELIAVRGTTTRVAEPEAEPDLDLELKIFTHREDCRGAYVREKDVDMCVPHVDRASGEVRLGYQFRLNGELYPMPAFKEHLQVSHQKTLIQDGQNGQAYTVIPHDPFPVKQLYVVLIDGSSSMAEKHRMDKVRAALLLDDVKDAFFPGEVDTRVALFQFTSGKPMPVGGQLTLLDNKRDYSKSVKQLRVLSGYTHLYDAITYATGELLEQETLQTLLDQSDMAVTIVALTDGFNNVRRDDLCSDNAERLSLVLRHLEAVRGEAADLRRRPTVYTVGLGRPLRSRYQLDDDRTTEVKPIELCGKRYRNRRIDGDLERRGIDNVSLMRIADVAGGSAYVRQDRDGLGEAFRAAAAKRYAWFEVRYRTDPHYLRRSFNTRLRLLSYATADANIDIYPSAWLDAPPGKRMEDGWTEPREFSHTLTIMMPLLGALVSLSYVGAALFNTRRALFGGTRKPKTRERKAAAPPAAPPPGAPPAG